ncbi:MAG TPA: DUF5777 family beta-barrel protein [Bacteroidia bacterium]|nr:DUF5777 family beta-barrel protein [Bacteroidia bacterium]
MKSYSSIFKNIILCLLFMSPFGLFAQETTSETAKATAQPVKSTFENGVLINNQTVEGTSKKSLDFMIQHRFGLIKDEKDIYGLFAPANIRLGLTYGITKKLSVGIGATKLKRYYDLQWKYIILQQTNPGGMPVTVTYYGDLARSANDKSKFLNQDSTYKGSNRINYFHELMVARKFNSHLSLQLAATYSHYNIVEAVSVAGVEQKAENDQLGFTFLGRYKFSPQSSILVDFDYSLTKQDVIDNKPNLGIGFEVSTGSHQFQVFVCSSDAILSQEIRMYNQNEFPKDILIGFNITRQWGF